MVGHEDSCRRWRACVAMHNMLAPRESLSCCSSQKKFVGEYPEGHWQDLSNFISALGSSDVALKMEALHHLALLLLYVAPTSESTFTCPDAHTISLRLQSRSIFFALKDIQTLHILLSLELAKCISWLFKQDCSVRDSGETVSDHICGSHCEHANVEFTVKIFRCCIYILPLLEFNTGLSLVAADTIYSLFKQLVCPSNLFRLSSIEFDEWFDNYRMLLSKQSHNRARLQAFCCVQCAGLHSNDPVLLAGSVEASIKGVLENLPSHETINLIHEKSTSCSLHGMQVHTDRGQIALALLEIFIEELVLQPRLAHILKASDVLVSSGDQFSSEKNVLLTVEAAAMHFILSFLGVNHAKVLQEDVEHEVCAHHGSRLSLPAAVMLLDLFMVDGMHAPDFFCVHIINMVRCSLNISLHSTAELPEEMLLSFAASALESATTLYLKCWKANANSWEHCELVKYFSDKFWAICDGDTKKFASILDLLFGQENLSKALQQERGSTHLGLSHLCGFDVMSVGDERLHCSFCSICSHDTIYSDQGQEQLLPTNNTCFRSSETKATLLISVLHLISTALHCLVAEASKNLRDLRTLSVTDHTPMIAAAYVRHTKEVFKFCAPVNRNKVLENLTLDKERLDAIRDVDELTGNAFTFFTERLLSCIEHVPPKALIHAYLEVLKSLLTLNLKKRRKNVLDSTSANKLVCKAQLNPSYDVTVATMEEERNTDEQPSSDGCLQSTSVLMYTHDIHATSMEEERITDGQFCSGQCQEHTAEFMSSTLLMTKMYQRKHKKTSLNAQEECDQGCCELPVEGLSSKS